MPRIDAPTVAEHRSRQREAILDAAGDLFAERGVLGTELKDIAEQVGLTRTALYRYFPDRDHIFVAWANRIHAQVAARLTAVLDAHDDPRERLDAWVRFQLDHAASPAHSVGRRVMPELGALPEELRERIATAHGDLQARLLPTITELVDDGTDPALVLRLAAAVVQAGALAMDDGATRMDVDSLVRRAVTSLI